MRTNRLGVVRSAAALLIVGASGCATGTQFAQRSSGDPSVDAKGDRAATMTHWKTIRDSLAAQELAEAEGPRVSVRVNLDGSSGSRRVEATFRMFDDAYVLVGHLGADGRVRVVFPTSPDDDGFVNGDKIYHVPSFFAGFTDEYRWRRANDGYHTQASRRASYDGGIGYVFVIASWRPMRFDRMMDAGKWETYEISDVRYMADPREAIDEMASVLAGDNREAYTIEYASYTKTNYGALSFASIERCNQSARFGFSNFGYDPIGYGLWSPISFGFSPWFGSGFGGGYASDVLGCGSFGQSSLYSYALLRPSYGSPFVNPIGRPPVLTPGNPGTPPTVPSRPREPGDTAGGPGDPGGSLLDPVRRPRSLPADGATDASPASNPYRRRGLIAEDARGNTANEGRVRRPIQGFGESGQTRPSIQEMLTNRRREERAARGANYDPRARDNGARGNQGFGGGITSDVYRGRGTRGHASDGSSSQPRNTGTQSGSGAGSVYRSPRGQERGEARGGSQGVPRSEPRSEPQRSPGHIEPRAQPSAPAPSAPPRQAPAAPASERKPQGS